MRLSVATNFEPDLIEALQGYPVYELFGKLPADPLGGGRASYMLSPLPRRALAAHIRDAHRHGIRFNYLLNAACLDNREWTQRGQREIRRLLDWLAEIGVDAVTVSLPYLLELIKRCYPQFQVTVGVFAGVDHVQKAKMWEGLGADCITLESLSVNRRFSLLASLREHVGCDLMLLVNTNCLQSCPFSQAHMVALSHASQAGHPSRGFLLDYCFLWCTRMKLADPVNYIRSDWIRPEDLGHYEALGYDRFKLAERNAPTEVMARRVRAYSQRRYDGNLLDLVQGWGFRGGQEPSRYFGRGLFWRLATFLKPWQVNPLRLLAIRRLAEAQGMLSPLRREPPVVIDNRALDGFLEFFFHVDCHERDCETCRYCHPWAERAVRIDPEFRQEVLRQYDEILEDLRSGAMWRYVRKKTVPP
ncbi:MAG: U32 family peptidase [Candidatus Rokubacteria bacterium]|nr:U32 family peptidase [Candidatus Rokubacteria bacterium]